MKKGITFLCISNYFKGIDFLKACYDQGCKVYLVTSQKTMHQGWPRQYLEDIFFLEDQGDQGDWNIGDLIKGTAHFLRKVRVDRLVALDDFDVEKAALLREEFRIPGMGTTTGRYFRDKLAMRLKARESKIPIPNFSSLFNDEDVNKFIAEHPGPWLLKPRSAATASGIKKVENGEQLWQCIHELGDKRQRYLVEQFRPGDVYHVDSLTLNGKVIFSSASRYLSTPMEVAHDGGIFRSVIVEFGSEEEKILQKLNKQIMTSFGMQYSASHTEFIRDQKTGKFIFLETSSRVGGARIAEMVQASSGINIWKEWAHIELAMARGDKYKLPKARKEYAGIIVSLSRFQNPDNSSFQDKEIVWRLEKDWHIGLIVRSKKQERVLELLDKYSEAIQQEFHAAMPSK